MVEPSEGTLGRAVRQAMEANLRYYEAVGRLTADYLRALAGVWDEARRAMPGWRFAGAPPRGAAGAASAWGAAAPAGQSVAAVVLEGAPGDEVRGAFVVTNDLPRLTVAPVMVSPFRDADGVETPIPLRVEPGVVQLEPGARAVVQVVATIGDALREGADYRAELGVPELSTTRIPVLLRRTARTARTVPPTAE